MKRLAALVLVAGCSTVAATEAPRAGVRFVPDNAGLAVAGSPQRIDFGRAPAGVIPVLDRELGAGRWLEVAGCPAGIAQQRRWGDLVLSFTSERFVGWRDATGAAGQVCPVTS